MHSETLVFENGQHQKHFVLIAETANWDEYVGYLEKVRLLMKLNTSLDKYVLMGRIQHSAFYETETLLNTAGFIFLIPLKLLLTARELNITLMYREGLDLQEVMCALDLKEDLLKKINKNILRLTGKELMKNFQKN